MPELLLEVGTEELPASFVQKAFTDLGEKIADLLREALILTEGGSVTALGTPRRLIIGVTGLVDRQPDQTKEQRGPSLKAAFDASGKPTPALVGFCRGQGVDPATVTKDEQYVWITKLIPGRPTREILSDLLPQAIKGLSFDKTMRWGSSRMRFARPIRWILASLDGAAVPFDIEDVQAGIESRGHRFYSPAPFEAKTLVDLLKGLRDRKVEPDPGLRKKTILDQIRAHAGDNAQLSDALVDENVYLTEWPTVIYGEFKPEYLQLPVPVLVTAMAKHEKMFPVRASEGGLQNRFLFVRNSGNDDAVRKGSEWVLNARFNDAKFFYDEDSKLKFDDFLAKTSGILFQEKLGTVRARASRLEALSEKIALATGADATEAAEAKQAGLYAKADLSTGLVSELSSLQGVIGGEYAKREGFPAPVAAAIATQYDLSKALALEGAEGRTAIRLLIADALDKLAGYLGLGLAPTGSSDPFGLRRAVSVLIDAAWSGKIAIPSFSSLFELALAEYAAQGVELNAETAKASLLDVFAGRYPTQMPEVRYDVLEASILPEYLPLPRAVRLRTQVMAQLSQDANFVSTATRPIKLIAASEKKEIAFAKENAIAQVSEADLDAAEGVSLLNVLKLGAEPLAHAVANEQAEDVVKILESLAGPITQFIDAHMILVDEPKTRYARLSLLKAASDQLLTAGDFTKIVLEG